MTRSGEPLAIPFTSSEVPAKCGVEALGGAGHDRRGALLLELGSAPRGSFAPRLELLVEGRDPQTELVRAARPHPAGPRRVPPSARARR